MNVRVLKNLFVFLACLSLATSATPQGAQAQGLSETDRKAAARAAYLEGVQLQEAGRPADALSKFEAAQKFYDAPTHLLHIGECQAATGKLVEASETYETLVRKQLGANPPEAFTQAVAQGQTELEALRKRIPTLRITVKPEQQKLQNLQINVNGASLPTELLGIARPVNPAAYRLSASATGYGMAAPVDVTIVEREAKTVELALKEGATTPPPLVPIPPPYVTTTPQPASTPASTPPAAEQAKPVRPEDGVSSFGMLLGVRGGLLVPGGSVAKSADLDNYATTGAGFGIDAMARVLKILLLGATFEGSTLGKPDNFDRSLPTGVRGDVSTFGTYIGVVLGVIPNPEKVSFIADVGFGRRQLNQTITVNSLKTEQSFSGTEFAVGAGVAVPIGPVRLVPKAMINFGSFKNAETTCVAGSTNCLTSGSITNSDTHTFFFLGLAVYYNLDLGKK